MNIFPYLDEKLNYQLYLLVYGQHKVTWYEKIIIKIQELIISTNQFKNYQLSILLLLAIGLIILIGYEIFKKCITSLVLRNQNQNQPQLTQEKFSCQENCNEKIVEGSSTICESSENVENCQMIQTSRQIPYVIHCEGYKKIYVFTFDWDELPVEISRELKIENESLDCEKYTALDEVQEVMMVIIDKVLNNLSTRDDCQSDELLSISPISPNTVSTQQNFNNQLKYLYNQSEIYKLKPASRIPLLLKTHKQRQFYKN